LSGYTIGKHKSVTR